VKQVLLVAGVDFEFAGVDFRSLADNRRRLVERRNTAREELRFTTMDARSGQVEVREVTFPAGKRSESVTTTTPFTAVGRTSYATAGGHTRFKPGQDTVMSITDVYAAVRAVGSSAPGTLVELSIFSHGWMGGPILVDSDDDRVVEVSVPMPGGRPPVVTTIAVPGTTRDPDDKDARAALDFIAPTMDAAALTLFRAAFASDGFAWLWGCAFPRVVHHTLWAMEHAKAYRSSGLADDTVLDMPAVTGEDVDFLRSLLTGKVALPSRTSASVPFAFMRWAICAANQSCYAFQLAVAAGVAVRAAALGTYAEYDTVGDRLMNVPASFGAHFDFYRNYLGLTFDPEGRRYAVYRSTLSCPVP
jgi:hypothetical protein